MDNLFCSIINAWKIFFASAAAADAQIRKKICSIFEAEILTASISGF